MLNNGFKINRGHKPSRGPSTKSIFAQSPLVCCGFATTGLYICLRMGPTRLATMGAKYRHQLKQLRIPLSKDASCHWKFG